MPSCRWPLPVDIDDREIVTVAVVGINRSGKTHYLASSLVQATMEDALAPAGFAEFAADEITGPLLHREYYVPLIRERTMLRTTQVENEEVRFHPLAFRASLKGASRCTVMLHDVAGEVLCDRRIRVTRTPYLPHAHAVIFLVDPLEIEAIRERLQQKAPHLVEDYKEWNQANLLNECINEIRRHSNLKTVPFAIVLSKSDLITLALDHEFRSSKNPSSSGGDWATDINAVDREVRNLLLELRARDIVAAARQLDKVSFHAVSALGHSPAPGNEIHKVRPIRVADPLATVLVRSRDIRGRLTHRNRPHTTRGDYFIWTAAPSKRESR